MSNNNFNMTSSKEALRIASHEDVINLFKNKFDRLDTPSSIKLGQILLITSNPDIEVKKFKSKSQSFIRRNLGKIEEKIVNEKTTYFLKEEVVTELRILIYEVIEKIDTSIKDIDDTDSDDKWTKSQIDGIDVYEITKHTMFQNCREKLDKDGKDTNFRYSFKKPDMEIKPYQDKMTTQLVNIYVNTDGEIFGFPLCYTYICPECASLTERFEYEVTSTNNKIKCPGVKMVPDRDGVEQPKRCNHQLAPDVNRTYTKEGFVYGISFKDGRGNEHNADAISFMKLPKGPVTVAIQKISRPYAKHLVHIVDFKEVEKTQFKMPEKNDKEHYLFTIINAIDKYIFKRTNYKHYGFLPAKIAMVLQLAARYLEHIKNNYHISLTGEMSSGKSAFSKYWSIALYSENSWMSNATSISIPKLRGTMETFTLFNKEYRYQYKGMFGEIDHLIIDEVKESPELQKNLKQYLLESEYDYSKQGSNNQTYKRTMQLLVTQNVDTRHIDRYSMEIKKLYQSDNLKLVGETNEPKPAWNPNIDLTLPLHEYDNPYLRYAIYKTRQEYERNHINWIDGSELALKQRFYFYYFLGSKKKNDKLQKIIKENSTRKIVNDNTELKRVMSCKELITYIESLNHLIEGKNDFEYFEKVDIILEMYKKRTDARTSDMTYTLLKLIRMIDGRDYCNHNDLQILQYIIENIDNKIEIADTDEFVIKGSKEANTDDIQEEKQEDSWGYKDEELTDYIKS